MSRVIAIAATLTAALILGGIIAPHLDLQDGGARPPVLTGALPEIAEVVSRVDPSVVSITTEIILLGRSPTQEFFESLAEPPEAEEPEEEGPEAPAVEPHRGLETFFSQAQKETRGGTGLVIDADGYVITNYHVVQGAHRIRVEVSGLGSLPADLVGADPETDLALLYVAAPDALQPARLGDSDQVRVGEWVLAIGDPLSFQRTVTVGVVSGKGRRLGNGLVTDYIQTDAAINVGNSGGPLLNLQGEVIGLNTAISRMSGTPMFQTLVEGVGFAIPSNTVMEVASHLRKKGRVARGFLGVTIDSVSPEAAEGLGLDEARGALVRTVRSGWPAASAGLRQGDVILEVGDQEVTSPDDMIHKVSQLSPGSAVSILVHRVGHGEITLEATLMDRAEAMALDLRFPPEAAMLPAPPMPANRLGFLVRDSEDESLPAPIVDLVDPMSSAWDEGVRPGTRVLRLQDAPLTSAAGLDTALEGVQPGRVVRLLLSEGNWGPSSRLVFLRAN